jgi:phosphoribosylformylglycinamidine cyclo-ligase
MSAISSASGRPSVVVDYIAVEELARNLREIGEGLFRGAEMAGQHCGGEKSRSVKWCAARVPVPVLIWRGRRLAPMPLDRVIIGDAVQPGEVVIGLASSGIHSNGLTSPGSSVA